MADRLSSSSIILIGGALAMIAIWLLTSLAVSWDARQRNLSKGERKIWIAVAVLFPLFGFALYLAFRVFQEFVKLSRDHVAADDELARRTAIKSSSLQSIHPSKSNSQESQEIQLQPAWGGQPPIRSNGKHQGQISGRPVTADPFSPEIAVNACVFTVIAGPNQGQRFFLRQFPALIGRGDGAAIPLDNDLNVSRQHAEILMTSGIIRIRDLKSLHGTKVNGVPVQEKMLKLGDKIQIGSTLLIFGELGQSRDGSIR